VKAGVERPVIKIKKKETNRPVHAFTVEALILIILWEAGKALN
jgi:hypothetical protein